jgi:hypothetical protein
MLFYVLFCIDVKIGVLRKKQGVSVFENSGREKYFEILEVKLQKVRENCIVKSSTVCIHLQILLQCSQHFYEISGACIGKRQTRT